MIYPVLSIIPSGVSLPFSPVKLIFLIVWVYICFYCVQQAQFSSLVPANLKLAAKVVSLFAGPVLFFGLLVADVVRKYRQGDHSLVEIITEPFKDIAAGMKFLGLVSSKKYSAISLVDHSGAEFKRIYRHGMNERENRLIRNLTKQIIWNALEERASDIIIEPVDTSNCAIIFRIDGILKAVDNINADVCAGITNGIKAISQMDVVEKRKPQEGSFIVKTDDQSALVQVLSIGVHGGEKLRVKILNQNANLFTLTNIGLSTKQHKIIEKVIAKQAGMIIVCGPPGSGKTTTLCAMLNEIDPFIRSTTTVENHIEYILPNINQVKVNPKEGFAKTLRNVLSQDPDVICVGEIRDKETTEFALRASQANKLILASMRSNSNILALTKLLDLGVPPLLIASGLSAIISQRLLRRLCKHCKVVIELTESQITDFRKNKINYINIFQANGCKRCNETGYHGMIAVYDILVFDNQLKAVVGNGQLVEHLKKSGDRAGKLNLQKQGIKQVVSGLTSLEELKRVIG